MPCKSWRWSGTGVSSETLRLGGLDVDCGNGSSIEPWEKSQDGQVYVGMSGVTVRTDGAQMGRYVDRVKQAGPVWEMQGCALAELGVDVAALWKRYGGVE